MAIMVVALMAMTLVVVLLVVLVLELELVAASLIMVCHAVLLIRTLSIPPIGISEPASAVNSRGGDPDAA